jgi:hypothetical protein
MRRIPSGRFLRSEQLARPERFELPTYSSGGCRSIQLSYGRAIFSLHLDSRAIKCRRLFRQCGKTCSRYVREELPATSSTTPAALTAATTTTTAAGAFGFGTRFVYVQCSSTNLRAVQRSDRFLSVLGACHFDKAKSARASSVAIRHDADSIHLAVNFEKLTQLFFGRVEIQVSNKDVLHANASGVSYLSVGASAGKQVAPEPFLESRPE